MSPEWQGAIEAALQAMPAYLLSQRWYPAKDAGVPAVALASFVPLKPEPPPASAPRAVPAALAVWTAQPPNRNSFRFFLPIARLPHGALPSKDGAIIGERTPGGEVLVDAFAVDAFVETFVRFMQEPEGAPAELDVGRTTRGIERHSAGDGPNDGKLPRIRRSTAEQSNTSIRIGGNAILKVIRKLEEGIHPELEMGRFLTEEVHYQAIPALLGWIDWDGSTLAVLQDFVVNEGDGWNWILARLRGGSDADFASTLAWITVLGKRTAEMHRALAARTGAAAFDAEPVDAADWQAWLADSETMGRRVLDGLQHGRDALDAETRTLADEFILRFTEISATARALVPRSASLQKTRHHGDFHLGQVLVHDGDATLVDFEGEPMRPLAERRSKHLALRDVAGMLRSFDYAAAVARREASGSAVRFERWADDASRAYLDGYFGELGGRPDAPGDLAGAQRLVQFFTIQKAFYEVLYELANRPGWVAIPLRSVLSLRDPDSSKKPDGDRGAVRHHRLPHGAEVRAEGGVSFRLWAPGCDRIDLVLHGREPGAGERILPMSAEEEGWYALTVADAAAGHRYQFALPDGMRVPDPASRFQPEDVHGPSEVIDSTTYPWRDDAWKGRPWTEAVVYELHVGSFTGEGTFRAAIGRLDHLSGLGVTAIELMPVADFPGGRNWGYDGVSLYAPDSTYGRPDDLRAFVDAAHERGLMVLLDVVYNHFGPDGNYLPVYAPTFFTDRHKTPWGAGINYDGPHSRPVREFVIHNALYWIEEYNLDGLRLDAVHAILDDGPRHVLDELAERVRTLRPGVHLVLENEENQARRLLRQTDGTPLHYTAQWNDDMHHVLHVAATGEKTGYYAEYLGDTEKLGRALAEGFAFQGQLMEFRGEPRGEPSSALPPAAFVAFIQNHDQIGNRAFGDRLVSIASADAVRAVASVYLLLPQVPMLFMGEEWGETRPFPFFCDFSGELADAVRKGRRAEFARFPEFQDEAMRERIPDPQAPGTFLSAKLDWNELQTPTATAWLDFYRRLLEIRREAVRPLLPHATHGGRYEVHGAGAVVVRWTLPIGELTLTANLSDRNAGRLPIVSGKTLWQVGDAPSAGVHPPWYVHWSFQASS